MSYFAFGLSRGRAIDRDVLRQISDATFPWTSEAPRDLGAGAVVLAPQEILVETANGGLLVAVARLEGVPAGDGAASARRLGALWCEQERNPLTEHNGDFAFAHWHAESGRLTVGRDFFGVCPLYYFETPSQIWVSTLPALLLAMAQALSRADGANYLELDETAVLDRLLNGRCLESPSTVWRSVRRVPPGSLRWWTPDGQGSKPRGRLDPPALPRDLDEGEVVSLVRSALDAAVSDRLDPHGRANIWMSGGLDSTSIAASCAASGGAAWLHTVCYERLIEDSEGEMAAIAASHLEFDHQRHAVDDYRLFENWQDLPPSPLPSEPELDAMYGPIDRQAADFSAVALTGFGADPLLLPERGHLWREISSGHGWRGMVEWWRAYGQVGVRPPLGLATGWSRWRQRRTVSAEDRVSDKDLPKWLARDFIERTGAARRPHPMPPRLEDRRGEARTYALDESWSHLFESLDAGARGVPITRFHPFFDRRVVELLLGLPSLPWCVDKWALRCAQKGRLPERIRQRPKTPLAAEPWPGVAAPLDRLWRDFHRAAPELDAIFDVDWIERTLRRQSSEAERWVLCGPALSFACWRALCKWR